MFDCSAKAFHAVVGRFYSRMFKLGHLCPAPLQKARITFIDSPGNLYSIDKITPSVKFSSIRSPAEPLLMTLIVYQCSKSLQPGVPCTPVSHFCYFLRGLGLSAALPPACLSNLERQFVLAFPTRQLLIHSSSFPASFLNLGFLWLVPQMSPYLPNAVKQTVQQCICE